MSIQLSVAEQAPAISYDKVHLVRLVVDQPEFTDNTATPLYTVKIAYSLYGVVGTTKYFHSGGVKEVIINDYLSEAMTKAANGDMTLVSALQSIEQALASVLQSQLGVQIGVV